MNKPIVRVLMGLAVAGVVFGMAGCSDGAKKDSPPSQTGAQETVESGGPTTGAEISQQESTSESESLNASGNNASSATNTKSNATTAPVKKPATSDELYKAIKGTTVNLWFNTKPDAYSVKVMDAFKRKYSCKIEYKVMTWSQVHVDLPKMVAAGTAPDYTADYDSHVRRVVSNLLMPIDDYVVFDDPVWDQDLMNRVTWKGKKYGMIVKGDYPNPMMIWYNKDLFDEQGVTDPLELYKKDNWTFETFLKTAKSMSYDSNGDNKKDVRGLTTGQWHVFMLANGGYMADLKADGSIVNTLDGKREIAGMDVLYQLAKAEGFYNDVQPVEQFRNQQAAMMIERPANAMGGPDMYKTAKFEIGMVPMPKGPDVSEYLAPCLSESYLLTTTAKNPLGVAAYIHFSQIYRDSHKNDADQLALRRKGISDEHLAIMNEYMKKAKKVNTYAFGFGDWYNNFVGMAVEVSSGQTTAAAAAAKYKPELQKQINAMLG